MSVSTLPVRAPVLTPRLEHTFLPAALEIVETPASPFGRFVAYIIILFLVVTFAWACLGSMDEVASAPGVVVPSGRTKVIQSMELGRVAAIHARDGQSVLAQQPLVELDDTSALADRTRIKNDLDAVGAEIERLKAALAAKDGDAASFHPPAGLDPKLVVTQRQLLESQLSEHQAKLAVMKWQKRQKQAEHDTIVATIDKTNATLAVLRDTESIRRESFQRGFGSKLDYLAIHTQVVTAEKDLVVDRQRVLAIENEIAGAEESVRQVESDWRQRLFNDLAAGEAKATGLAHELDKADDHLHVLSIRAPISGTVQQVSVHTIGGVVTPGQTLMTIVPSDDRLLIRASVADKDIGFVKNGQQASIKISSFDFTRYGLLHATVTNVSRDAIAPVSGQERSSSAASDNLPPSSAAGKGAVFAAELSIERPNVPNAPFVALRPGMQLVAEVRTGRRRIISYLLSPVLREWQESMRER